MSQADLSRLRESATSYHSDIRDRMMGRAKRTLYHQGGATSYLTGYGMDFSCFQGLMQGKGRQDRRETFRQHGLATSGRTYHDQIMSAGCGHLHRTLHVLLSPDIGEIAIKQLLAVVKLLTGINDRRPQCRFPSINSSTSLIFEAPYTSRSFTTAASQAFCLGKIKPLKPSSLALIAIGNAPFIGWRLPSIESSPINTNLDKLDESICSAAARIPIAKGRS